MAWECCAAAILCGCAAPHHPQRTEAKCFQTCLIGGIPIILYIAVVNTGMASLNLVELHFRFVPERSCGFKHPLNYICLLRLRRTDLRQLLTFSQLVVLEQVLWHEQQHVSTKRSPPSSRRCHMKSSSQISITLPRLRCVAAQCWLAPLTRSSASLHLPAASELA